MWRLVFLIWIGVWGAASALERVAFAGRYYLVDLPREARGAPMILALHGGGGNPKQFARSSGLGAVATARGFAVVFPAGSGRTGLLTWNAGYCCAYAARAVVDDVGFLAALIAEVVGRYGLDPGRIYVTGMSNGSMMAETFAARRPDLVRAVAGVSGTPELRLARHTAPVPLLHIHGTADELVPFEGGRGEDGLARTEFSAVEEVMALFALPFTGARRVERGVVDGARVSDWEQDGRVAVRLMAIEGGGHVWPGGRRANARGDKISASAEIVRFFEGE